LDRTRLDRLTTKSDETEYDMIKKRNTWVAFLNKNMTKEESKIDEMKIKTLFDWADTQHYNLTDIERITET
jgi:hypothetical protein